jgi:DNA-binding NarL/FixJ family response regulator
MNDDRPSSRAPHELAILIVDDHAIVREGLKRLLDSNDAHWKVEEAASGHEALERLRTAEFDVVITDISMPGMSGLELLRRVRIDCPKVRVLMLSMHAEEQYALRAFKAGANGYVTKDCAARELAEAVRKVCAGGVHVSPGLAERMVMQLNGKQEPAPHDRLSDRELEVMRRLVAGERPSHIAEALHLSVKTVSTYKSRLLDRLQLPNTAALIRYAMEHDLTLKEAALQLEYVTAEEFDRLVDPAKMLGPTAAKPNP